MYNWSYVWKLFYKCYTRPKMFRKIKQELTEDFPPLPAGSHRVGRCCAVLRGETLSTALPRDDYWMPQYWPAWQGIVRCCNSGVKVMGSTNQFLMIWGLFHKRRFVTNGSGGHRPDGTACHCFAERTYCQAALWSTNLRLYPLIGALVCFLLLW